MAERFTRMRMYKDTTANWKKANPILLDGEIGFEAKTNGDILMKVGNGLTAWNLLPYANSDGGSEVAEARINENGDEFASLKERLDDTDNRISEIGSGGSSVGQVDATEGSSYHGEIFNSYSGSGKNIATANFSHAEGYKTSATGAGSHAEGYYTIASAHASHAEGYETTASDAYAHSEGYKTIASKMYSHAEGFLTRASSENQHVQGIFNVEDTAGTYAMIIGNGSSDTARSNALTVDWSGNVECGNINGVDVNDLLARIIAIESQLSPVIDNLFDTSMIYYMLTQAYVTVDGVNYYYASVDTDNNVISFIYDSKGINILNDGALFEADTQYIIEADIKTSTATKGTDTGTSYNGMVEIQYSDKTKVDALVNNTSEYVHVSYTTESGKTVSNLYVNGNMVAGLNVDTILYIKNLVIRKV